MSVLYRNDQPGEHAPSWYADSVPIPPLRSPLKGDMRVDVAIIGAGYTGLWAALTLARAGRRVVVLDAHRAGFGASGRNGGQLGTGYNVSQSTLEKKLGEGTARALWDLSQEAKRQAIEFCAIHAPEAAYRSGLAYAEYRARDLDGARRVADKIARSYGYETQVLGKSAFAGLVKSPAYAGGTRDPGAGHLNPLAYALALAREAETAGATIHERTEVTGLVPGSPVRLTTPHGTVTADHAIAAGNGYLPDILPPVNARVMPINSFIAATAPIPARWRQVLDEDIAVSDSRFVVNYYRFTADRRFLFGGRESYTVGFPRDIAPALAGRLATLFPQIADVPITHVWGGSLAVTMTRLPHIARVGPNILSGAGFSGHGVALSGMAGRVMAEATLGQTDGIAAFEALPVSRFPGGATTRAPLLTLAMTWYALRDRFGI